MHEVKAKGILSASNGMNIYRGCTHGCIYCDSRSLCYQMNHAFEDVEVKQNAPQLLEQALRKKRKKCMIGTGAMTDPYLHLEEQLGLTRKCIEIIDEYGFGLAILTKSNRILRDIDLLNRINQKSKCVVQITLTTYEEELCKRLEPNVSTTKERFEVLMAMKERKIPTVVWLGPILPFINDTKENLEGILNYCKEAKVKAILCFGMGVTLRAGNREYFYKQLDQYFPGIKQQYIKTYGYTYEIVSENNNRLMAYAKEFCSKNDIIFGVKEVFEYLNTYEEKDDYTQLTLF